MFAVCPPEVDAKVRPFLKNVQLFVSSQWIPYPPAERAMLARSWVELGGRGTAEGSGEERREVTPEFQPVSPSLMILCRHGKIYVFDHKKSMSRVSAALLMGSVTHQSSMAV